MGNAGSSSSSAPSLATEAAAGTEPSDEQVQEIYDSLREVFEQKSVGVGDKEWLLMKLRAKLQVEHPSAMGGPRIAPNIVDCIGQTPLVKISNKINVDGNAEVVAKVEYTNPALSVKDRIAKSMIEDAERRGIITKGETTIIDVTSGNTGIAYGMVAASKGYKAIQIIPEPYSIERRALMMALGVDVIIAKKEAGFPGAIKVYQELLDKHGSKGWAPRQFDNPANIDAHLKGTGPEIYEQCGGKIDVLVAGMGTGGTLSGCTRYLRSKNPEFICVGVEPMEVSLLSGDKPCPHGIQGISPPFIPGNAQVELIDEIIRCPTKEAMQTSKDLALKDGIAVGISAGANVWAACQLAKRPGMTGKRIVTFLPSAAERYFSTPLYADLMEQAKGLTLATFDPNTKADAVPMTNLATLKENGTQFRPGFHVT